MPEDNKPEETAQKLQDNPEIARLIAEKIPGIVQEEFAKIVGPEVQRILADARADVERKQTEGGTGGTGGGERRALTKEESAEYVRCVVLQSAGLKATPRMDIDGDGLVQQALTSIEGSSGGYLLPEEFVAEVEKREEILQNIWPLLQKRTTRSRKVIKPEMTDYPEASTGAAAKVNSATTGDEITESNVTFGQLEWDLEDSDMRFPVKLDLIEESPIDIYNELIDVAADELARKRERFPIVGRGHTQKEALGLTDDAAGITKVAIDAAPSVTAVLDFIRRLPQEYRARATMVMPGSTFFKVAGELAQNVNAPQFLTQLRVLPPMVESPFMTEGQILYGDFNRYVVYSIRLMQIITSVSAERKMREIVVTETWTGRPTIKDAFRIGTGVTYS